MTWRPITEPIIVPRDGTPIFWIEDGDRYRIIPPPKQECSRAKHSEA